MFNTIFNSFAYTFKDREIIVRIMADNIDIPAKLPERHKIENIYMDVADKGEIIISWTEYIPANLEDFKGNPVGANAESKWEDHKHVCNTVEEAWDIMKSLYSLKLRQLFAEKNLTVD